MTGIQMEKSLLGLEMLWLLILLRQPNKPVDTNFISQITSAAHLTTEESERLTASKL
jgi:hypothetical protein